MERENLLTRIKSYKFRANRFKILEGKDGMRRRSSIEKMLIADRRRSVSWFCSDAKYLKKIDYDTQFAPLGKMPASQYSPQYYLLEDEDLLAYFGFRTALRIGDVPQCINNYFISLYLMEILNGIYGDDSAVIEKKLDGAFALLLQKEKKTRLKKHLIAAYGNLVFLQGNPDYASVYEKKIGYELFPHTEIRDVQKCSFPFLVKCFKLESHKFVSPAVLYVMELCYKEIASAAFQEGYESNNFKENDSSDLFLMENKYKASEGIRPLFVDFPLLPSFSVARDTTSFYQAKKGLLFEVQSGLSAYSETITGEFLENLLRVVVFSLDGPKEAMEEFSSTREEEFSYFHRIAQQRKKNQHCIFVAFSQWLKKRPYLRRSYLSSVTELNKREQISQFSVNTSNIEKIRKESASIQDKLIIEEEDEEIPNSSFTGDQRDSHFSSSSFNHTLVPNEVKKAVPSLDKREKVNQTSIFSEADMHQYDLDRALLSQGLQKIQALSLTDNPSYTRFAIKERASLSVPQKYVVLLLFLHQSALAERYCRSQNLMLSVVVEEINQQSLQFIDDVFIEENEIIEDYYEVLPLLFQTQQKHSEIQELVAKIAAQKKTDLSAVQRLKALKEKNEIAKRTE